MKRLIPLIAFMVLCVASFAQKGVNFEELTFDEALAKAKTENKLVFVDCYTTWCGPCKQMSNVVFPQEAAGNFFNPQFVCVKYDMEKGEGIELKKKLNVKAYPSFFIVRPDGTVQHSIVGGDELEGFINRVKLGLNEKTSLLYLNSKYEKGKMSKKELLAYKMALSDAYDQEKGEKIGKELAALLTDKDKLKVEFWPIFEDESCTVGSADFKLLVANLPAFEKNIGKEKLDTYLYNAYSRALTPYISGRAKGNTTFLKEMQQQISGLNIAQKESLMIQCQLAEVSSEKNVEQVLSILEKHAPTLSGNELWAALSSFAAVKEKATKADFNRMVALGDKIMANTTDERIKEFLGMTFDGYKKSANIGVYFEDLTLEQALEKAKKQRKMIFMDGYTSWCGPCKYMSNTIFPQEKVGDFMNKRFICVKYDMEKGEGPELAKRFDIHAYPTFVIIKPDGSIQHKMVGGGEADAFIESVKEGLDATKASGVLDAKYAAGNRDKEFLLNYAKSLLIQYSQNAGKVVDELMTVSTDEEKVSESYWFIFGNAKLTPKDSEREKYLLANREKFNASVGKDKVDARLSIGVKQKLIMINNGRDTKATIQDLEPMKKEIVGLKLNNEKSLLGQLAIAKAVVGGNDNQVLAACEKEVGQISLYEFPVVLIYNAEAKATPSQMARWVKICEKIISKSEDKDQEQAYVKRLKKFVEKSKTEKS